MLCVKHKKKEKEHLRRKNYVENVSYSEKNSKYFFLFRMFIQPLTRLRESLATQGAEIRFLPSVNSYVSLQVLCQGEVYCTPHGNPKRFNSLLSQNPFRILERSLNNN